MPQSKQHPSCALLRAGRGREQKLSSRWEKEYRRASNKQFSFIEEDNRGDVYSKVHFTDNCKSLRTHGSGLFAATETSSRRTWNFKDDSSQKENRDNFILIHLLTAFCRTRLSSSCLRQTQSRYTRYNVIFSLNDHVETNGGKR